MSLGLWDQWNNPTIDLPIRPLGYLLAILYVGLLLVVLYRERNLLRKLKPKDLYVWIACLALAVLLSKIVVLRSTPLSAGAILQYDWRPQGLLVGIPILLASTVGIFPAALTGLVAGLMLSLWGPHDLLSPFEMALWGIVAAYLIRQDYRGRLAQLARLPVIAGPVGALAMWGASWLSCIVYKDDNLLSAVLYCWRPLSASLPVAVIGGVVAGFLVQLIFWIFPSLIPVKYGTRIPGYARSLKAQLLYLFAPTIALVFLLLFYAVNATAIAVATEQSLTQAMRDSHNAAQRIPFAMLTGQGLLSQFAGDGDLLDPSSDLRQHRLDQDIRTIGFFKSLILLDRSLRPLNTYPPIQNSATRLEGEEVKLAQRVISSGAFQISSVYPLSDGSFAMSFLAPVIQPSGTAAGVLIGRVEVPNAPMMQDVMANLQGTIGAGKGFVVDQRGLVALHPDKGEMLTPWIPNPQPETMLQNTGDEIAYIDADQSGARWLVYYSAVEGSPWKTAINVPYEAILNLAARISTPFTIALLMVTLTLIALISLLSSRLTRPIEALSEAAAQIAQGKFDVPITVAGEDEVGHLGNAFETMRVSLQERLKELALLLNISRVVSANLNVEHNLEPILSGALEATTAMSARIILVSPSERADREISMHRPRQVSWRKAKTLTGPLARLAKNHRAIKVRDASVYPGLFFPGTATALGYPLLIKDRLVGILVVEYESQDSFPTSEIEFLSTLAGQAAVAIESTRLFEAVESERHRLSAILTSTNDSIIVTDSSNYVLLVNPAAEHTFGLKTQEVIGQPISKLGVEPELIELLVDSSEDPATRTKEITLPDKRVLYASASPIGYGNGQIMGCVAVLRDITHLKEIDTMKSEFVATVSHDLRSPLTYMKGYTTLIVNAGPLSDKQREFVEKIRLGITQMTELIDNLLDLGKIEAGVGVNMTECQLDQIVQEVIEDLTPTAQAKKLELSAELPADLPPITADETLIRQALTNLVDNAIKYTRQGWVRVSAQTSGTELIVSVKDSGIGIPATAQVKVFEKFYRVRTRDSVGIQGSGLGLSIVKSIADLHQARVYVESKPGQGSTFSLVLPLHQLQTSPGA
jgi:PAS domain S-box-containing protein